jgi:hypothetical protein
MTLSKRKSSPLFRFWVKVKGEPYFLINIILAGVILLILAYSGIFSPDKDNYPVTCIHEKITGLPCSSCGLSHSFSLIVRGRINEAYQWNIYGMRVFLFFSLQLVLRVAFSYFWIKDNLVRKQLIIMDISGSIVIFLVTFYPFFKQLFLVLF